MSRIVIFRFCLTVGLFVAWLAPQPQRLMDGTLAAGVAGAATVTCLLAVFFREPFRGPVLNRWDETLGYIGIAALGHAVSVT